MKLGKFTLQLLNAGRFKLDAGSMFGIVPKVFWEKIAGADSLNRIELGLNVLLIEKGNEKILVDTGIGTKLTPKKKEIYSLEQENGLVRSLARLEIKEADITRVILTHLHFDHSGGATRFQGGSIVPAFGNALYYVQKGEYKKANSPDELSRASYLKENFVPLEKNGKLRLIDGGEEIIQGVKAVVAGGHTPFHQMVKVESGKENFIFFGDLIPTSWHLRLPYIPAYDRAPEQTLEEKKKIIELCVKEKWKAAFPHDPSLGICCLEEKDGEIRAVEIE